jgi:V-type H+-transporting ATPase subunit C
VRGLEFAHSLTPDDRFIVRDFVFSEDQIEKQKEELAAADTTEKELWVRANQTLLIDMSLLGCCPQTELLQISRTNFSESFQILVHLKVLHLFVESVLRYGLPANYQGLVIKVSMPVDLCLHALTRWYTLPVPARA